MSKRGLITRRGLMVAGLATVGGVVLARSPKVLPPTYGHLLRMGDTLTYATHRALLPGQALAREFERSAITSFPAIGTTDPGASVKSALGQAYKVHQAAGFAGWKLRVEGLVDHPRDFTLAELKALASRTQVTRHTCEEGWSAIAEWTGVPLGAVLHAAGMQPSARFVTVTTVDEWADSLDLFDALHPQTLLAYGMNGHDLPVRHGGPVRLRVERQLGYKSLKFLHKLVVTDVLDDGGAFGSIQNGWAWYTGI
jgi:DMSO/TMAO reductase YedYZ molybdopterin-dependent catalytic subunit